MRETFGIPVPIQQLLKPLETNDNQRLQVAGQTVLVVTETNAQWGTATVARTPIDASATVTNPTPLPVPITELRYTVRLNGIVVGQGSAGQQTVLRPDSTPTLEATAVIDNAKLDEWWVTHLRNDEQSTLTVAFNATLADGDSQRTVPLEFLSYERPFETDLLGSANASVTESPRERTERKQGRRVSATHNAKVMRQQPTRATRCRFESRNDDAHHRVVTVDSAELPLSLPVPSCGSSSVTTLPRPSASSNRTVPPASVTM